MHEIYYRSMQVKLGVSEADCQFTTLANAKACAKCITGPCGPTLNRSEARSYFIILANTNAWAKTIIGPGGPSRAYRKQTANLRYWPMRRPAQSLLRVPAGHAERIGSRQPFYNIGQYEGMREIYYRSLWANPSVSEADCQFTTLADAKACAKFITGPGGPR